MTSHVVAVYTLWFNAAKNVKSIFNKMRPPVCQIPFSLAHIANLWSTTMASTIQYGHGSKVSVLGYDTMQMWLSSYTSGACDKLSCQQWHCDLHSFARLMYVPYYKYMSQHFFGYHILYLLKISSYREVWLLCCSRALSFVDPITLWLQWGWIERAVANDMLRSNLVFAGNYRMAMSDSIQHWCGWYNKQRTVTAGPKRIKLEASYCDDT